MQENLFFSLFAIAGALAFWFAPVTQKSFNDLVRSGLLDLNSYEFLKTAAVGGGIGFLVCLFAQSDMGSFAEFSSMFAFTMTFATVRVIALAAFHGVDSTMAFAMAEYYEGLKKREAAEARNLGSEQALQHYFDLTYGRGKASARDVIKRRKGQNPDAHAIH